MMHALQGLTARAAVWQPISDGREAGIPIESSPGRFGGYRVGRGFRIPPLVFSTTEALGLVMAALEGRHGGSDARDPVGSAQQDHPRSPWLCCRAGEAPRQVSTPRTGAAATNPAPRPRLSSCKAVPPVAVAGRLAKR